MTERLNVSEVAAYLRKSQRFVRDELTRKNLRGSKIGGEWFIGRADLDSYIEAHANVSRVRRSA